MQSVIVYRNPMEAMFWESGIAFPLFTSLFVFVICYLIVGNMKDGKRGAHGVYKENKLKRYLTFVAWVPACVVFYFVSKSVM